MVTKDNSKMPIYNKYCLTIAEASEYFGICEKKIRQIINENADADFVLCNGIKYLIKRKKFEQYIDEAYTI